MKNFIFTIMALCALALPARAQVPSYNQQSIANLVVNGSFEAGRARWSTFQTTVTALQPTTAPAACSSCTISIAATTGASLGAGKMGLQITSTGAITAGHGVISNAFTIPVGLGGKSLSWALQAQVASGLANLKFAGDSTNTWQIYYWDVTNLKWVQPQQGLYSFIQGVGPGAPSGTVQFDSNTTSVQMALIPINASSGASVMYVDDFATRGAAPNTDSRVISVAASTNAASAGSTTAPFVYNVVNRDSTSSYNSSNGKFTAPVSGDYFYAATGAVGSGTVLVYLYKNGANIRTLATWNSTETRGGSLILPLVAGDTLEIRPSAAATMNADVNFSLSIFRVAGPTSGDEGRAVTMQVQGSSSPGAGGVIGFTSIVKDSHAGYSIGTGGYTIPIAGDYRLTVSGSASTATNIQYAVNGTAGAYFGGLNSSLITSHSILLANMKAGNVITALAQTATAISSGLISIERVSGPNVPQSQFDVPYASAVQNANNGSYPGTGVFATMNVPILVKDSTGSLNTSTAIYTVPTAGEYELCSFANSSNTTAAFTTDMNLIIGSLSTASRVNSAANQITTQNLCFHGPAKAGDQIYTQIRCYYSSGSCVLTNALGYSNGTTIKRIGN